MYCSVSTPILMLLIVVPLVSTEEGHVCDYEEKGTSTTTATAVELTYSSADLAMCKAVCSALDFCKIVRYDSTNTKCQFFDDSATLASGSNTYYEKGDCSDAAIAKPCITFGLLLVIAGIFLQ